MTVAAIVATVAGVQAQTYNFDDTSDWAFDQKFKEYVSYESDNLPKKGTETALKISFTNLDDFKFINVVSRPQLKFKFTPGTYEVTANIFIEQAPEGFVINIKDRKTSELNVNRFNLKNAEVGKWIEVKKIVEIGSVTDGLMVIGMNDKPGQGAGIIYIASITYKKQ